VRAARWIEHRESRGATRALAPLALAYGLGSALHRGLFERGWLRRRQISCRVLCVGGLLVGGSGKTPVAAALALELKRRGLRVVLGTRGYGRGRGRDVAMISDGRGLCGDPLRRGDEPLLLAGRAPGVPVWVGGDRGLAGLRAVALFDAEVLVLDDGFQHHRLARDLDIVTLDGHFGLGNGCVLPRGPLREPLAALSRADALVVVDGPLPQADRERIEAHAPGVAWFGATRWISSVASLAGDVKDDPSCLAGARVGLISGLARPQALRRSLEALGAEVVAERIFPDHHRYRARDLKGLGAEAAHWITTEKDAVKILPSWGGSDRIRVVRESLGFEAGEAFVDWLAERLSGARG
jgi:tetraacyldisaccharide 4'-kinase